jgi:phage baseplate assembly protein W
MSYSDYNSPNSRIVAPVQKYSDLDLRDPFISPLNKDVNPVIDIEAVKNSVRNLVLTNFYEVPFDPYKGSNIRALLFENADSYTAMAINKEITRVITQYEPRVNVSVVNVIDQADINSYAITINFNVIQLNIETEVNFYLERIR